MGVASGAEGTLAMELKELEIILAESLGRKQRVAMETIPQQPTPMGAHGGSGNKNSHLFQNAASSPHLQL